MAAPKKPKSEDLDFQIGFYEGVVRENPSFAEALIALGEVYTKKGLYDKGLAVDKKLASLRPDNPVVHYNLACSLSLLGDATGSFRAIRRAVDLGYDDFAFMQNDPDLANLRSDERFVEFIRKVKKTRTFSSDVK